METTYYHIETNCLAVYDMDAAEKASGGPEIVYYAKPKARKKAEPVAHGGSQVVDLDAYRRQRAGMKPECSRMETPQAKVKKAGKARRWSKVGLALDLLATGGIIFLVVGVLLKLFLP